MSTSGVGVGVTSGVLVGSTTTSLVSSTAVLSVWTASSSVLIFLALLQLLNVTAVAIITKASPAVDFLKIIFFALAKILSFSSSSTFSTVSTFSYSSSSVWDKLSAIVLANPVTSFDSIFSAFGLLSLAETFSTGVSVSAVLLFLVFFFLRRRALQLAI